MNVVRRKKGGGRKTYYVQDKCNFSLERAVQDRNNYSTDDASIVKDNANIGFTKLYENLPMFGVSYIGG